MLEDLQRGEGRLVGAHRVIVTGSRVWGYDRRPPVQESWIEHERAISRAVATKLVGRYVIGLEDVHKRDRSAVGPGLAIMHGDAPGLDTLFAKHVRDASVGLRRRTRAEFRTLWQEPELAEGLWLFAQPADWDHEGTSAGTRRNQLMLERLKPDRVIAFFAHEQYYGPELHGGTNDMVRRAHAAGIPVDIYSCNNRTWLRPDAG